MTQIATLKFMLYCAIQFSWVISRINVRLKTNVFETASDSTSQSMMETELISETMVFIN